MEFKFNGPTPRSLKADDGPPLPIYLKPLATITKLCRVYSVKLVGVLPSCHVAENGRRLTSAGEASSQP